MAEKRMESRFEAAPLKYGQIEVPPCPPANQQPVTPETESLPDVVDYALPWALHSIEYVVRRSLEADVKMIKPPEHIEADYCVPLQGLVKERGYEAIAGQVGKLQAGLPEHVAFAGLDGPFLNIAVNKKVIGREILADIERSAENYGLMGTGSGGVVILDTSSPNIAKQMSIGHLRSTVIGESLGRIYQNCGYTVIRDNHLGDWGTQFGILGRAYELWKDEVPELRGGNDPVKGLQELYVRMHQAIEEEKDSDAGSDLRQQGLEWFRRLEEGDPEASELWKWAKEISQREYDNVYNLLGSNFEYVLGESEYVGMIPSVIDAYRQAGLLKTDEGGRIVIDLDEKLKDLPVVKSDGTSLYATRDLACLAARSVWFQPEKIIYVVGGEQKHYFEQVFKAFEEYADLAGETTPDLEHVYFGMIKLPEGKMSTRRGNVVILEDVINEAVSRAREKVAEHAREASLEITEAEIDEIARQVGVGAVIYSEVRQGRKRTIEFDMNEALSFTGNSGPYLQYTNARINAIFRRLGDEKPDTAEPLVLAEEIEGDLALKLGEFPEAIYNAMAQNEPSVLAEYLYELGSLFNNFYRQLPILQADKPYRNSRLRLSAATATVLRRGMYLLGMPVPEKM